MLPDVRGLRSEIPDGAGNVVRLAMRKRRRVMLPPVLLVNVRRIESVPKVELFGGSLVKSRATFGESKSAWVGSSGELLIAVPTLVGADKFSGPGAPRRWPAPALVPFVSTNRKSLALSLDSWTSPVNAEIFRTKL